VIFARQGLLAGVNVFQRPLQPETFTDVVAALVTQQQQAGASRRKTRAELLNLPEHREALIAADQALEMIFDLARRGARLDGAAIEARSELIVGSIAESGLGSWIAGVRFHHDMTYQHCLLVTGLAIGFGHYLGFGRNDLCRLAIGALLHDVGKARVPVGILDKPTELTAEERKLMQRHPEFGIEMLRQQPSVSDEARMIVLQHHEHLDGSGYPMGLTGDNISDIVRLMTIADVFGALIEKRGYKPAMSGEDAYAALLAMEGKIDMSIAKAIKATALTIAG
jgi:putative nucleotidyltransferase with HDIG domain